MPSVVRGEHETGAVESRGQTPDFLTAPVNVLKQSIHNHPGIALLISASVGVFLAWLSKRR